MGFIIRYDDSEADLEIDITIHMAMIVDGQRDIYDENGDRITDFSSFSKSEIRQMALEDMGDDWSVGWVYKENAIGADSDSAMVFASQPEASAFIDQHFSDFDGRWTICERLPSVTL